ncbi:DNA repair protein RadC [Peptostreptococcus anaerobius]|uniref:DNA repair protein RadC n=1 Tax=Peptostreptococcus anaerobius TaxID=1261 RepID=A0A379CER0_9FIRM|nr:JAB domain-containing protein [Peptostreptococcus anaerobius]SFM87615.1 DNA repair protein radc [Peptostreptococcus anaerobius]SUB60185.1 DNA repair protein RadC [Peptostreptococcus anaerobius]
MRATIYKTAIKKQENGFKMMELVKEASRNYKDIPTGLNNPDKVYQQIERIINPSELSEEEFWVMCLDVKNKNIGNFRTSKGTIDCTVVHPREVFKGAILLNSANIILTHNHPTGNPTPSEEDIELTKRLVECGELLGIKVLDHIITGDGVFHSLREHSQM